MFRRVIVKRVQGLLYAVFIFILGTSLLGCLAYHEPFVQLKLGMTKDDVSAILGNPSSVDARRMPGNENREVWRYIEVSDNGYYDGYLNLMVIEHSIVFSNDLVAGWDMPNPFIPVMITENKVSY